MTQAEAFKNWQDKPKYKGDKGKAPHIECIFQGIMVEYNK